MINIDIKKIKPYEKNAKKHPASQIKQIADSIKRFGFKQPLVLDKDNVIVVGHGRWEAAKIVGLKEVPCISAEDLTPEEIKAYRLADNKLNESPWEMGLAVGDLKELDEDLFSLTGFDMSEVDSEIAADEINQIASDRDIDLGKYNVLTVEAPEAPRLKARASFYFEDIKEFRKVKKFFSESNGRLDTKKLCDLIND
tara:strand:- start:679 stop:1269 length:591 start_codon:yes stop_codon:yes gene_type:complete